MAGDDRIGDPGGESRAARAGEGGSAWILLAVGIGSFMSALDASIVNVVLPVIRDEFSTTVAGVQWVVTVYLLVVSATLLGFGRIGDLYGHKRTYLLGFWGFVAGSVLCALSPSTLLLSASRGIQALGAAVLFATSPAIVTVNFPAERRGRALGMIATATYVGLTVGPPLGGWLADVLTWRAIFFINIPIGAVALSVAARVIPTDEPVARREPFDFLGAALFTAGLVAMLVALNQGAAWGWSSAPILGLLSAAAVVLAAFVAHQKATAHPMLDLSLFSSRTFTFTTTSALLNYVAIYALVFLMPFYLIQGRGLAPSQAGTLLAVQPAIMAVIAPLAGALSDRVGSRWLTTSGMAVMAAGLVLLAGLPPSAPWWAIVAGLGVVGAGTGTFISPNNSALMGAAPRNRQGTAAGVLAEARNVGMVLGVGMAGAIFTSLLPSGSTGGRAYVVAAGAALLAAAAVSAIASVSSASADERR